MKKVFVFAFLILNFSICNAVEVLPVGDFRFFGGQYFYKTSPSSLSGNLSLTFVPALKFSSKFSLIPTYLGTYRGTKEVADLAGGGTLFQDEQGHFISVKGVYTARPGLKLKLGASYRYELLRETKDETWGKGLFDYRKTNAGFEAEYNFAAKFTARLGIDSYMLRFPNYASLESSVTVSGLGRELAGTNTLDSDNLMLSARVDGEFGRVKTGVIITRIGKNYPDQTIVINDGSFIKDKRNDTYLGCELNASRPFRVRSGFLIAPAFGVQYSANTSNQAHYDASHGTKIKSGPTYIPNYYNYTVMGYGPGFDIVLGKTQPVALSASANVSRQSYSERLSQDTDGNYLDGDKIHIDQSVLTLGVLYPVSKGFKLRFSLSFIDARSNMQYEKTYAYNYTTSNYLMGFSYEF